MGREGGPEVDLGATGQTGEAGAAGGAASPQKVAESVGLTSPGRGGDGSSECADAGSDGAVVFVAN